MRKKGNHAIWGEILHERRVIKITDETAISDCTHGAGMNSSRLVNYIKERDMEERAKKNFCPESNVFTVPNCDVCVQLSLCNAASKCV